MKPPEELTLYFCGTCNSTKLYPLGQWHRDQCGTYCKKPELKRLTYKLDREEERQAGAVAQYLEATE